MPVKASGTQTRERLIEAAFDTLRAQGMASLTLDAVAREAGVSKGGLLHHFPSKEALIAALLHALLADYTSRVQHFYDDETDQPGRWLRAYVRATFADAPLPLELSALLLLSITEQADLLRLVRDNYRRWSERLLEDGLPTARVQVVRLAADAYWMDRLLGIEPQPQADRDSLMRELLRLAGGES